jgi:2-hydroxyisobutanoyl-CoA mutase large subunit
MTETIERQPLSQTAIENLRAEVSDWESNEVASFLSKQAERKPAFFTLGDIPVKRTYTAADLAETPIEDIGLPGRYPFTRGPYPTMYRSRTWTMRQIAGFGTGEDTNRRFKYLIAQGQTGISTDFDMPTLMGYDSDHPMSEGEVGREGVAIDTLADMEALLDGIDLEKISVSLTINPSAWILLAMYIVLAEKRGLDLNKLSGTIQADILKEYMAQKEYIFPIEPSVRIVRDCITYCAKNMKRYNPINISGYHISEAGSSPLHEAAFTLANLIVYVEEALKTGMQVDEFAPRLAFFFVCQADFFEEVAKFRALRRCYAKIMKERFGAKNPESMRLRFHCQTAAASLTKPQYMVNVVRTSMQALAAVLGGCQSLHTNGYDEAFAIPTEDAMRMALRTQQIIAEETNVTQVTDPLGGSYFVESLTTEYEKRILEILEEVNARGGTIKLIQEGWFQRHIADFAYETALRKQSGEKPVIGVNCFVDGTKDPEIHTHPYDQSTAERQIARTRRVRSERDGVKMENLLRQLMIVAKDPAQNILPITIELVRSGATMGEIVEALKDIWGCYRETPVF